ncbi:MAG: hypothetical protein QXN85_00050, partial [Candidatus Bathyarchaeia archaeon]
MIVMRGKLTLIIVTATLFIVLWYYLLGGSKILAFLVSEHYAARFISALALFTGLTIGYLLISLLIKSAMLRAGAKEGEVVMINNVIKACL